MDCIEILNSIPVWVRFRTAANIFIFNIIFSVCFDDKYSSRAKLMFCICVEGYITSILALCSQKPVKAFVSRLEPWPCASLEEKYVLDLCSSEDPYSTFQEQLVSYLWAPSGVMARGSPLHLFPTDLDTWIECVCVCIAKNWT
jgi:hypothetical protein